MAIGFSRAGITMDANQEYLRLFGYSSAAELRGRSILEQIAPSHRKGIQDRVDQRALGVPQPNSYLTRGLRKDGTEFPFEVSTALMVVEDGPLAVAFIHDVSEREKALEALRASEERFRSLSAAAMDGVFIHADGRILVANEAGAAMYGFDPASMVGAFLLDLTAAESRDLLAEHCQRGGDEPYEGMARRRDGSTFHVEVRARTLVHQGRPARVAIIRDVTERKRAEVEQRALEERVRQAQKFESLGVLAGGVAHDFNNILTIIANGVALAKREAAGGRACADHLDTIELAAKRAAELCRQMMAYTGKAALAREPVDLTALVAEMMGMLEASISKKAALVRELTSGLPALFGDATQVRQIVMNLVLNASEAIVGHEGSVIVSTGSGTFCAEAFARSPAGGNPKSGPYVYLEVRDDGVGMDEATVAQMFDPFFTTKFVGRGLGMAAVLGIVRGHSGAIDVESAPGGGTRIRVFFPASAERPVGEAARPAMELQGQGVVLVVDDEESIRKSTRMLLEEFGFEVIVARDGVEGVEAFRRDAHRIGAVLLDLTMPRMDGVETLQELRSIAPDVPVILTTGYGAMRAGDSRRSPHAAAPDAVLAKPYAAQHLLAMLQQVMALASGTPVSGPRCPA
jgi:PAS domain S-box-containing protein